MVKQVNAGIVSVEWKVLSKNDCDLSTFEGCLAAMFKTPQSAEDAGCIEAAFNHIHSKYRKTHVKQLIEAYLQESGANANYLLMLIADSGSKVAFPIFLDALRHEIFSFREIAARGLAKIGDKQCLDALRSAYDSIEFQTEEETAEFRKMIAKALWGD